MHEKDFFVVAAKHTALQHRLESDVVFAPRPLPLFLEYVQKTATTNPELARRALAGVRAYGAAARQQRHQRRVVTSIGRVRLLDGGGVSGPLVLLVPSLINPSHVLDLAPGNSLLDHLAGSGFRPMLLDWGCPGPQHRDETIGNHICDYLLPIIEQLAEPVHLAGYCLGGTMAMAASQLTPLRSLTLIATPWRFDRYPDAARRAAAELWDAHQASITAMGLMPLELLQALFWGLDPDRTVAKYAALADLPPNAPQLAAFTALEDWSNGGAPLTAGVARELLVDLVAGNASGAGQWTMNGYCLGDHSGAPVPAIHFTARNDKIAPAETAAATIATAPCPAGHVGMVVGSGAREGFWQPFTRWLSSN